MNAPRMLATRLVSAALLAWLSVFTTEPLGLHSCPMHGGLALEGGHSGHSMSHQGHGMPGRNSRSNQCSCPGDCSGPTTSIALVPESIGIPTADLSLTDRVSPRPPVLGERYTPRLLPFANGPPEIS